MPYTDFHYTPTGTGVISGKEVLEQTEDAINDLGTQISGDVQTAIDTANNALNTANTASADAQNAVNTANTAYTAATNAQNTANTAQNTASNALTAAQNAQNDVNALGNRVTTAEGNITQNTNAITGLTTRMGTAEGNITTLQNDVITAQGTATSAQNTATLAREQAYVLRYASSAVTPNSTVAYSVLNNTDNVKVGDSLIDTSGQVFLIVSVDNVNETVTVGAVLLTLALDANVMHLSGNETVGGSKTFTWPIVITSYPCVRMYLSDDVWNVQPASTKQSEIRFTDKNSVTVSYFGFQHRPDNTEPFRTCWRQQKMDGTSGYFSVNFNNLGEFYPENNNVIKLGKPNNRWLGVYAMNYYYGANEVEFSTKFVTTDTNQTISGEKTFSRDLTVANTDTTANTPNLNLRNYKADRGTVETSIQTIMFLDKNAKALTLLESRRLSNGNTSTNILCCNTDDDNNTVSGGVSIIKSKNDTNFAPNADNTVKCGRPLAKWSDVQTYKINGLTPSSLSLPSTTGVVDISSYITDLTGTANTYTVLVNGYIQFDVTGSSVEIDVTNGLSQKWIMTDPKGFIPVVSGASVSIKVVGTAINNFKFIPCQGNV